ncbi:MAG: hypothetical protein HYX82_04995 [Chloroflexi bacterium]|nr:hypothetical protein [Chloroflexota bacterium]
MASSKVQKKVSSGDVEAVSQLKRSISSGKHWYIALLEAIGLWTSPRVEFNGRKYDFLIDGEAFDWLLLAERLCQDIDGLVPEKERNVLLFFGEPPIELSESRFRHLIGAAKYRAYLNYFYGVVVEEALILAVEGEVRKERHCNGMNEDRDLSEEVYRRIYGASRSVLLRTFRDEKGRPHLKTASLGELKEFTYWLFKYRLKYCDSARVASDTRKGLNLLQSMRQSKGLPVDFPTRPAYAAGPKP